MATLAERLASVQSAIAAIESGAQNVTHEGRTVERGDLRVLYDQEERLEKRIANTTRRRRTIAEF